MKFYFQVLQFNFARNLAYPSELIAALVRKIIYLLFLVIFWNIVFADNESIDIRNLASYFLVANGLAEIVMSNETRFGRYIRRRVKHGVITSDMIKPVNIIPYLYASTQGKHLIGTVYGLLILVVGILIQPPESVVSLILFSIFSINAFFIGIAFNLFEGTLSLLITEVNGIKNALRHIGRILSGMLVPLTLFPDTVRKLAELTFFPYMIFVPADSLQTNALNSEVIGTLVVSTLWAAVGLYLNLKFWGWASRKYEAIGI